MEQIKISAKNLGQVALEGFCPRCFWIKLKTKTLPWQIFPGIFSSIDGYTKKVVHAIIDDKSFPPRWLQTIGDITSYRNAPHWSKFSADVEEYGITLNGVVDDILVPYGGESIIIPDYKTAKYTPNQDKLLPLYQIQLNAYALIAESCKMGLVSALWLVYFEPVTDEKAAVKEAKNSIVIEGFAMGFKAHPVNVPIDRDQLNKAMETTRQIYDMVEPPDPHPDCKDCQSLDVIFDLLKHWNLK